MIDIATMSISFSASRQKDKSGEITLTLEIAEILRIPGEYRSKGVGEINVTFFPFSF